MDHRRSNGTAGVQRRVGRKLDRWWRIIGTGGALVSFMVGGFLLALLPFAVIRFLPLRRDRVERFFLGTLHFSFKVFLGLSQGLGLMERTIVEHRRYLSEPHPALYVANHPTVIDIVVLISLLPHVNCVVKKSLWHHFFLGPVVRAAGFIPNDHPTQLIEDCRQSFRAGKSLVIFPEGTRSSAQGLRPFSRGTAQIALRTGAPIVPIVIKCTPPAFMKYQPWYDVPERRFQMRLVVGPPMAMPDHVIDAAGLPMQARRLTRHLEDYFHSALDRKPENLTVK